jgi:hypothetical protein
LCACARPCCEGKGQRKERHIDKRFTTWLTTIAKFREPWEAHLFCGRLRFEGIPAMVAHECHVSMNWPWSNALGGVKVQVPRSWVREAQIVQARCRAGDYRAELQSEFGDLDDLKCPVCSAQVYWERRTAFQTLVTALLWFYFGAITPPWSWLYHCEICGAKWKDRRGSDLRPRRAGSRG